MLIKEELVHYLTQGHIHVSRQDYLFFTNLEKFSDNKSVTTGQNKLLDKLLDKYKRQLAKENLHVEELKKLQWKFDLVETRAEYLQPKLSLEYDTLVLRTPYNKKLISEINKYKSEGNFFTWDKENRYYSCKATNYSLKKIVFVIESIFDNTLYCDNVKALLDEAAEYEKYIWKPTLTESNGNYYIAALNETLYDSIKDMELNSNAKTLFELSKYCVFADDKVLDNDEKRFAINFHSELDLDRLTELIDWLKNLEIYTVSPGFQIAQGNKVFRSVDSIFTKNGIKFLSPGQIKDNEPYVICHFRNKYSISINFKGVKSPSKFIFLRNTNPIEIQ